MTKCTISNGVLYENVIVLFALFISNLKCTHTVFMHEENGLDVRLLNVKVQKETHTVSSLVDCLANSF
jgi:hypothetical protein